jgi:stearoyl-CoA desaturase (delta-9 desaturase)
MTVQRRSDRVFALGLVSPDRPWAGGWLRWAPGQGPTLLWIVLIHACAIVGLVLFPIPDWRVLVIAIGLAWLGGLGTTVAYHRALAHGSLRLHPVVEFTLVAFAVFNGSGAPAGWAANHRLHHARSDREGDISSPRLGGFWWSHLRWLWQVPSAQIERWAPDLDRAGVRVWTRWQFVVLALSLFAGLPFGWAAFFWIGAIRLTYSLHGQCLVNSAAHMAKGLPVGECSAKNLGWLSVFHFFQGESWHANHHARPSSARLGWRWWQFDVGWWTVAVLERLRLATHVRSVRETARDGEPALGVTPSRRLA